jgi:hypothetical protein
MLSTSMPKVIPVTSDIEDSSNKHNPGDDHMPGGEGGGVELTQHQHKGKRKSTKPAVGPGGGGIISDRIFAGKQFHPFLLPYCF